MLARLFGVCCVLVIGGVFVSGCSTLNSGIQTFKYYIVEDGKVFYQSQTSLGNSVQIKKHLMVGADPMTIRDVGKDGHGVDKSYVYHWGKVVPGADPETFEAIDYKYARDKNNLYRLSKPVEGADPATFKQFYDKFLTVYYMDSNFIYFDLKHLKPCDIKSFKVIRSNNKWAADKKCVYHRGQLLEGVSPIGMEYITGYYAKNQRNVYYGTKIIEGADPSTFGKDRKKGYGRMKDKNRCYNDGAVVDCSREKEKSIFDMSVVEAKGFGEKMRESLEEKISEARRKRKDVVLEQFEKTLNKALSAYKGNILTPDDVEKIDLSGLELGYQYKLVSSVSADTNTVYILRIAEGESYVFDKIVSGAYGFSQELRNRLGQVKTEPLVFLETYSDITYLPYRCDFVVGECTHQTQLKNLDKEVSQTFQISFKGGVWTKTYKFGKVQGEIHTVYDLMGAKVYEIQLLGGKVVNELSRSDLNIREGHVELLKSGSL